MAKPEKLGIWMDHQNANLMEFTTDPIQTKTIQSKFSHEAKELSLHEGEHRMHNKEQHQQAEYFKELGNVIRNYKAVLIFGPTDAKKELYNILKEDHRFAEIQIDLKSTDKMSDHEQHTFVKEFFSKDHATPAN